VFQTSVIEESLLPKTSRSLPKNRDRGNDSIFLFMRWKNKIQFSGCFQVKLGCLVVHWFSSCNGARSEFSKVFLGLIIVRRHSSNSVKAVKRAESTDSN